MRPTWRFSSLRWRVQQPTGRRNTDSWRRRTAHQSWTHNHTINNLTSQVHLYHLSFKCDKDKSTTVNTCSESHSNHSGHWRKGLRQPERGRLPLIPKQIFLKKETYNHLSQLSMQVHYSLSLRQGGSVFPKPLKMIWWCSFSYWHQVLLLLNSHWLMTRAHRKRWAVMQWPQKSPQ